MRTMATAVLTGTAMETIMAGMVIRTTTITRTVAACLE
jgi:hypothetical protein